VRYLIRYTQRGRVVSLYTDDCDAAMDVCAQMAEAMPMRDVQLWQGGEHLGTWYYDAKDQALRKHRP
jgi:hypothetical protein